MEQLSNIPNSKTQYDEFQLNVYESIPADVDSMKKLTNEIRYSSKEVILKFLLSSYDLTDSYANNPNLLTKGDMW